MRAILIGTRHPHSWLYQITLAQIPDLDIVGIVSDGGAIHGAFRDVPVYPNLQELASDPGLGLRFDAAFVFLPGDEVIPALNQLIEWGKHVFCEKPVARSAEELGPIVSFAEEREIVIGAGYTWRVHPVARWIKEQIDRGFLGTLLHIEARLVTSTIASRGTDHYLFSKARSGGGITHWLGCHHIDLLRYWTESEVVSVSAVTKRLSGEAADVEDLSLATLELVGGCIVSLIHGYLLPISSDDPFGKPAYDMGVWLRGTRGYIDWTGMKGEATIYSTDPGWIGAPERQLSFSLTSREGYGDTGYRLVLDFIEAVKSGSQPISTGEDALEVLRVVEAIYTSSTQRQTIQLDRR